MRSGSLLFNPSQASTKELESTFVGRHELLDRFEHDLLADRLSGTPRHWQIIGPRGSGKSHFTELLARRMQARHGWSIARLPEENYQVGTLGELLAQIVARADSTGAASALNSRMAADEATLQERAIDVLRAREDNSSKPLLVVLENLSSLLERQLRSTRDQARLRDILTNTPPFILVATSTSQSDATTRHSAPFYDFFHNVVLDDLDRSSITELVRARADWEQNASLLADFDRVKGRIDAVYHLSGGNPRLALALYRVIEHGVTVELHDHILKLLDEVTPYYQARLNDIPPQALRVLTEMAVSETLATPAAIAKRCRLATNQVTAQISKLLDERLIVQGSRPDARSRFYEFKDRLLRTWIQMRESVGAARRLRFLAEFFDRWYAGRAEELEEVSRRTVSGLWSDLADGDEQRCGDRLKTLSYLADIEPGFDRSVVLRVMAAHVGGSSDADIRAHIDALQRLFDASGDLREREALAFLIAVCYSTLDATEDSKKYLRAVVDDGSDSEAIASKYTAALVADSAYVDAAHFGRSWLRRHPDHVGVAGNTGVAAIGIGEHDAGIALIREYLESGVCPNCTARILRRSAEAVRSDANSSEIKRRIWNRLIAGDEGENASDETVDAVFTVLTAPRLSSIRVRTFAEARKAWRSLSTAPVWFLSKAICGLAHRRGQAGRALEFISAAALTFEGPLNQYIVDHLVDILPELRSHRERDNGHARQYHTAMAMVRDRTSHENLSVAFRSTAPTIAKRYPALVPELMALYDEWIKTGALAEPITPYAEALATVSSPTPARVLQSLHPETREAVALLLNLMERSHKGPAIEVDGQLVLPTAVITTSEYE